MDRDLSSADSFPQMTAIAKLGQAKTSSQNQSEPQTWAACT